MKRKPSKPVTRDDVRRIVRNELKKVFARKESLIGFKYYADEYDPDEYYGRKQ